MKNTSVFALLAAGLFIHSGNVAKANVVAAETTVSSVDTDGDGKLSAFEMLAAGGNAAVFGMADRDGDGFLSTRERRGYNKLAVRVIALKNKIAENPDLQDAILSDANLAALYGDFQNGSSVLAGELYPISELARLEKSAAAALGEETVAERNAARRESEERNDDRRAAALTEDETSEETLGVGPVQDRERGERGARGDRERGRRDGGEGGPGGERDRGGPGGDRDRGGDGPRGGGGERAGGDRGDGPGGERDRGGPNQRLIQIEPIEINPIQLR